jgi:hypothetical protein
VINGATAMTESEIETTMARYPGAIASNGGATLTGLGLFQVVGNMRLSSLPTDKLTYDFIEVALRTYGYLYLVFYANGRNGLFSHAIVVYGRNNQGFMIMDPAAGRGLMTRPISYFLSTTGMLLGVHALAGPVGASLSKLD